MIYNSFVQLISFGKPQLCRADLTTFVEMVSSFVRFFSYWIPLVFNLPEDMKREMARVSERSKIFSLTLCLYTDLFISNT